MKLGTARVVFLVIAAAAPLAAMVGNVPLALGRGNGQGLPIAFVFATLILLSFSIGYAQMSKRVVNTGAFYTYIARSLGKPIGVGSAYLAVISYLAMSCGLAGGFGYFTSSALKSIGLSAPWWLISIIGIFIVAFLTYRSIDLSAKVVGTLMVIEFLILIVFDFLGIAKHGAKALPSGSFTFHSFATGSLAIAMMFAFTSFVGFESAALYGEETKEPEKTIPRASYIAVLSVGIFYIFTTWVIVGISGNLISEQQKNLSGTFVLDLTKNIGGDLFYNFVGIFFCTSLLASFISLHNGAARYLFALGREGVLPKILGQYHPRHFSPFVGSFVATFVELLLTVLFLALRQDPYSFFAASMVGLGTLGIVALQALAALAVIFFFKNRRNRNLWKHIIAPGIGFIGLALAFVFASLNYSVLVNSKNLVIHYLTLILVLAFLSGLLWAVYLKRKKPDIYHSIAASRLRLQKIEREQIAYKSKYCLVGAGPGGLIMGRSLLLEGVDFDWYEKHSDVGGIWDINRVDTPMYESAHFISSKYLSGFAGFPMPKEYPDYPRWDQILKYIKDFATHFSLYEKITFNTEVISAVPADADNSNSKWRVKLSNGLEKIYDGLIVAPGVTWHPYLATYPGMEKFKGKIRHSQSYSSINEFKDKKVLIVGGGNSAVDIACDAAKSAEVAYISLRRGYRFIPKHIFGIPTDALVAGIFPPPKGVIIPQDKTELVDSLVGDLSRYGLNKPDHDLLTSHPIMNSQIIHHFTHGDIIAKPDIKEFTEKEVIFQDGSKAEVDLVIMATGYDYKIPFLPEDIFPTKNRHPQLYLNIFSRKYSSLSVIGFSEFADAAYQRYEEMAALITMDIYMRESGKYFEEWEEQKRNDHPDLTGGMKYIDSARHANYVEAKTYQNYLYLLFDKFEWSQVATSMENKVNVL